MQLLDGIRASGQDREVYAFDSYAPPRDMRLEKGDGNNPYTENRSYYARPEYIPYIEGFLREAAPRVRGDLILGYVEETLPPFLQKHTPPICWVHFGTGLYNPTQIVLNHVWQRISIGGIIFVANGTETGENQAVQEFLQAHPMFITRDPEWYHCCIQRIA